MMVIEYSLFTLALILLIAFVFIWSMHFLALSYGKYLFHKKPKRVVENDKMPGVSILKPLMGVDDNLLDNLETFFTMDYPLYEILFCVQDNNDPAIGVVKHLIDKYPNVDAKLYSGGKFVGINPKINNMVQGYDVGKFDLILISDAGIKMAKDTLFDMASRMTEKVGLVHQMPFVCDRPGFAGALEKVYFGTCHCRMYLFINLLGINCVTGMSCLMRRSTLDQLGGLQYFSNYIAEDYFIAQAYLDAKWRIALSHQPAMQNSASYSIPTWQKRMIRWCKLRLKLNIMSWFEPIQECLLLGLCGSWAVNFLFGWNSLVFFLIHILGWFLSDYTMLKVVQNGKLPFSKLDFVISWFYRETICFYLFVKAAANPTVKWRQGRYRLRWGGLAEEIKPEPSDIAAVAALKITVNDAAETKDNNSNNSISGKSNEINSGDDDYSDNGHHQDSKAIAASMISKSMAATKKSNLLKIGNGVNNLLFKTNKTTTAKTANSSASNHKRTSSYSVMMMKNQSSSSFAATNNYINLSDQENNSSTTPLLLTQHSTGGGSSQSILQNQQLRFNGSNGSLNNMGNFKKSHVVNNSISVMPSHINGGYQTQQFPFNLTSTKAQLSSQQQPDTLINMMSDTEINNLNSAKYSNLKII